MSHEDKKPLELLRYLTVGDLRRYIADLPDSMPIETEDCEPCSGLYVDIDGETHQAFLVMNRSGEVNDDSFVETSN